MEPKELKNHTIALILGTALFFDFTQWLLAFIFMDWVVGFFAGLTFYLWFKFYGMNFMTPKRLATMGGTFVIEIVPILSALPAWTGAVAILILDHKAKRALYLQGESAEGKQTEQKGPPLPKRPVRPTMEHVRYLKNQPDLMDRPNQE